MSLGDAARALHRPTFFLGDPGDDWAMLRGDSARPRFGYHPIFNFDSFVAGRKRCGCTRYIAPQSP
jgi:hypothetical protein